MAQSTAPTTFGSILGLVSTTANTATGLVDTVAQTIGLASSYVNKAANEQRQRHALDAVDFTVNLIQDRAQAAALRKEEIAKFRQVPERAKYFDEAAKVYQLALNPASEEVSK